MRPGETWLLASAAIICGATPASAQVRRFEVPSQPASTGIPQFARQAGVQILVTSEAVDGVAVNRVSGVMDVSAALRTLLRGTDIVPTTSGSKIVLKRRGAQRILAALPPATHASAPGQARPPQAAPQTSEAPSAGPEPMQEPADAQEEVVVTGIRRSLEKAAAIKQNSTQIVDSIVSEDIGKFPDPTTAAALQRVPGVQVSVTASNEIGNVRVRGLGDILTTVDGREIITTTGRTFSMQDVPADALARVDVVKSNTAELIEGGIAGIIDLQLNKPFNFKRPTVVVNARGNYGLKAERLDPQLSILATDTWQTGIGDIGALVNVSWSKTHFNHPRTREGVRRSAQGTGIPFNMPGVLLPNVVESHSDYGWYERPQANASLQWQASDSLQVYADGLYTGYRSQSQWSLANAQLFMPGTQISNIELSDECITARGRSDSGQSPLPGGTPAMLTLFLPRRITRLRSVRLLGRWSGALGAHRR